MFSLGVFRRRKNRRAKLRGRKSPGFGYRPCGIEPLEGRLLLNGDPLTGGQLPPDDPGPATTEQFERFASADALREYLVDDALSRWDHLFGQPAYHFYPWHRYEEGIFIAQGFAAEPDTLALQVDASAFSSDTNVQVAGVDEGDIVEVDGDYLYVISDGELTIVDAFPAEELRVASRFDVHGQPLALYLSGERLTIISRLEPRYPDVQPPQFQPLFDVAIWPSPDPIPPQIQVTVLDIYDRESPQVVEETEISGRYIESRAVGDHIYVITGSNFFLPGPLRIPAEDSHPVEPRPPEPVPPDYWILQPDPMLIDIAPAESLTVDGSWMPPQRPYYQEVYENKEDYLARIEGQILEVVLPSFVSFGPNGQVLESGFVTEPEDVYRPLQPENHQILTVAAFNIRDDAPGPVSSVGLPDRGDPSQIYASRENLYLAKPHWTDGEYQTSIVRIDLGGSTGIVELSAIGAVPGSLLNQFSMDEHNGYLRVATTQNWGTLSHNDLYVLEQNGLSLDIVGRLENLAPGERIYSARFMGDVGFVVTFRQVDPLFSIDLSDPAEPKVVGELKIPGFSGYLQAVDDGHLFGIGRNADPNSGRFQDPQISLFNVRDLSQPELLDRFTVELGRGGSTEATYDHHAIGYFPEYKILAVPFTGSGFRLDDGIGRYTAPCQEMWIFRIDVGTATGESNDPAGISLLHRIAHPQAIRRTVRIDDLLYLISADKITVHKILDPQTKVAELHLDKEYPGPIDTVAADVELRLVRHPTRTGPGGQTAELPSNEEWIDEWRAHWAEVWVKTTDGRAVSGGSFDLAYRTEFFTATEIDYGVAFAEKASGEIDDVGGTVSVSGEVVGETGHTGESWVLLARVKFESVGDDHVPASESSRPYEVGLSLTAAELNAVNAREVDETLGAAPDTELRPVAYDVNDDNVVDFSDLAHLASVFLDDVIGSDSQMAWTFDFDRTGRVDFADFAFFAANFRHRRGPTADLHFDDNFGRRWVGPEIEVEGNVSVDEVFDAALDAWQETLDLPNPVDVQLAVRNLPGDRLGETRILDMDDDGLPRRARIILDDNAAGAGWRDGLNGLSAATNRAGLLDVLIGEIGKTFGSLPGFAQLAAHAAAQLNDPIPFETEAGFDQSILAAVADRALGELQRERLGAESDVIDDPLSLPELAGSGLGGS